METSQYQIDTYDYVDAFKSVRLSKTLCWLAIVLAIAIQLAGFILVRFVGVIDSAPQLAEQISRAAPAEGASGDSAEFWYDLLHWALPATKFLALVAAMLLSLTLLFAVKLAILGRFGGVGGMVSAFFWSLILLAMVTPWQQVFDAAFASGALYNLGDLIRWTKTVRTQWGAADISWTDQILYYARLVAFPVATLVVWLIVQLKFARGLRNMKLPSVVVTQVRPTEPQA